MDLSPDVIGTNPQYKPVVDHTWLAVDLSKYDNFPSDNNPVRIQPKLSEMWVPEAQTGLNLVPNTVKPCPCTVSRASTGDVVRTVKKAMMSGLTGHAITEHLRSLYSSADIEAAKEDLQKLASEQGLLGNVYIDASAFSTYSEAEQFLNQHRTRLAKYIIVNEGNMSKNVVSMLANKFHRNIVSGIDYNQDLFDRYKMHLVSAGRIGPDFVINSKETLRRAFMTKQEDKPVQEKAKEEVKLDPATIQAGMESFSQQNESALRIANEEMLFSQIRPIIIFAREQLSKGKAGSDLKEVLRSKYPVNDLKAASKYLALISSNDKMAAIDSLVKDGKIAESVGDEIKKIASKLPIRAIELKEASSIDRSIGDIFAPDILSKIKMSEEIKPLINSVVDALRKGATINQARKVLSDTHSKETIERVMTAAVAEFNSMPAGVIANKPKKAEKEVIEEKPAKPTLPEMSEAIKSSQDVQAFYAGFNDEIPVDGTVKTSGKLDIDSSYNRAGIDTFLG